MNIRLIVSSLVAFAALCGIPGSTRAQIFVANFGAGTIGEYTTSGATVNPGLISGLNGPFGVAVSGGNLFVTDIGRVGKYTTSGMAGESRARVETVWVFKHRGIRREFVCPEFERDK